MLHRNHAALFGLNFHEGHAGDEDGGNSDDSCEEDDDDYQFYDEKTGPNCQRKPELLVTNHSADEMYRKFSQKINVDKYEGANIDSTAANRMVIASKKLEANK